MGLYPRSQVSWGKCKLLVSVFSLNNYFTAKEINLEAQGCWRNTLARYKVDTDSLLKSKSVEEARMHYLGCSRILNGA